MDIWISFHKRCRASARTPITVKEPDSEIEHHIFNSTITEDEVHLAIRHLKQGEKPRPDEIIPEFFLYSIAIITPILIRLFNKIFASGEFPSAWCESIIVTIHKKGDVNNVENYRGISLQNVISKIYCCILVNRLNFFAHMFKKNSENQSGFKADCSTIDNAFILKSIVDISMLRNKRRKLYVAFSISKSALTLLIKSFCGIY
jgi:hypothetical protein